MTYLPSFPHIYSLLLWFLSWAVTKGEINWGQIQSSWKKKSCLVKDNWPPALLRVHKHLNCIFPLALPTEHNNTSEDLLYKWNKHLKGVFFLWTGNKRCALILIFQKLRVHTVHWWNIHQNQILNIYILWQKQSHCFFFFLAEKNFPFDSFTRQLLKLKKKKSKDQTDQAQKE